MSDISVGNQLQSSESTLVDVMRTTSRASRLMQQVSAAVPSSTCMRVTLKMVLVCFVFFCGFAMGCLSVGGTYSSSGQKSDALRNTTPSTPEDTVTPTECTELQNQATTLPQCTPVQDPTTPTPPPDITTTQQGQEEEEEEQEWKRNKDRLVSLGCRPRPTAVQVPNNFSHGDHTLYPTHLVVERCLKMSSFCGSTSNGIAIGVSAGERCVPSHVKKEDFQVMYYKNGNRETLFVPVEVHKNCSCDNGTQGTLND